MSCFVAALDLNTPACVTWPSTFLKGSRPVFWRCCCEITHGSLLPHPPKPNAPRTTAGLVLLFGRLAWGALDWEAGQPPHRVRESLGTSCSASAAKRENRCVSRPSLSENKQMLCHVCRCFGVVFVKLQWKI